MVEVLPMKYISPHHSKENVIFISTPLRRSGGTFSKEIKGWGRGNGLEFTSLSSNGSRDRAYAPIAQTGVHVPSPLKHMSVLGLVACHS